MTAQTFQPIAPRPAPVQTKGIAGWARANLFSDCEPVMEIVTFIRQDTSRGICQPVALEPEA